MKAFLLSITLAMLFTSTATAQELANEVWHSLRAEVDERVARWLVSGENAEVEEEDAEWLEQVYARLGYRVDIDPGEFDSYFLGIAFASMPDSQLVQVQQMEGVVSREELLRGWVEQNNLTTLPFEKDVWRSAPLDGRRVRYRMYKDLRARTDFVGMSRAKLVDILGRPDAEDEPHVLYNIGPGLLMRIGILRFRIIDGRVEDHVVEWID